ncbi:MAG: hypothetical protein WAN10_14630 [Candidatus Acidiferrales bacterium]
MLPIRALIFLQALVLFSAPVLAASGAPALQHAKRRESRPHRESHASQQSLGPEQPAKLPFRVQPNDDTTRQGFEDFYNMDYDGAIVLFKQELTRFPNDPFVVNHLLAAVLAKELNREGQLDATLYMGDKFLELKAPPLDPQVKNQIDQLSQRGLSLANAELAKNPKDADALFARAVARGLATVYSAVIEKRWLGAMREGLGAYHDDERVLRLNPNYADAKLVVGTFQYIVGSLTWWERTLVFVADMRGSKTKGLALLQQAVDGDGEESIDASTILALFLARENRNGEALALLGRDYAAFPHNFIFGLAVADLLNAAGKHEDAIAAYRKLVELGEQGFFPDARVERAAYSLGLALRGEKDYPGAVQAFDQAIHYPHANPGITAPAALQSGEVYDLLGQRNRAVELYQQARSIAPPASDTARAAARFLQQPYRGA